MAWWIPYCGTGINEFVPYHIRSQMTIAAAVGWDVRRKDPDYNLLHHLLAQWRQVAPFYYGDYYPLTAYSTGDDAWAAWQFDRPESRDGMVQAFRRRESPF